MKLQEKVPRDNKDTDKSVIKNYIIGTKYYKFIEEELSMIRLLGIKDADAYAVDANGTKCIMSKAEFDSYRELSPDGYIRYCIVDQEENVQDVEVLFYRRKDFTAEKKLPFAVCRQNLPDFFKRYEIVDLVSGDIDDYIKEVKNDKGAVFVGCSISQESCPSDIEFAMLFENTGRHQMILTACYLEDTLDDLLKLVSSVPYDDVLRTLQEQYEKYSEGRCKGTCSTLKELLESKRFINDVYRGFREVKVDFDYEPELMAKLTQEIEDIGKSPILDSVWIPFDREVNLQDMKDEYLIVRDASNKLWIVSDRKG